MIADKEKKSSSYKDGKLDALSDEKTVKIKKFAKEYIAKVLRKLEKSGKRPRPPSSAVTQPASSTSMNTPNSTDGVDVVMADMTVEEAMDMDPDSESGEEEENVAENGTNGLAGESASPKSSPLEPFTPSEDTISQSMELDELPDLNRQPSDPRRRPPMEDKEFGWEPHKQLNGVSTTS